jgi:hypothetical protein
VVHNDYLLKVGARSPACGASPSPTSTLPEVAPPWHHPAGEGIRLLRTSTRPTLSLLLLLSSARLYERGLIEKKHSSDVESPPLPPPRVCMNGFTLKVSHAPDIGRVLVLKDPAARPPRRRRRAAAWWRS